MPTVNTTPIFQAKPSLGSDTSPGTLNTSTTAPTNVKVLDTGAADGTRIRMIRAIPNATLATAIKLNLFLHVGANYYLFDEITIGICTVSTTSVDPVWEKYYEELVLPSGVTLEMTATTSAATGTITVTTFGWDYTP